MLLQVTWFPDCLGLFKWSVLSATKARFGLLPPREKTAGHISCKAHHSMMYIHNLIQVEQCHLMAITDRPTWHLRLVTFVHVLFSFYSENADLFPAVVCLRWKVRSANSSHETISVMSDLMDQSHFTLHIRRSSTQKSCTELSQTRIKKWRMMCSGKFVNFSGLIGSISIKRKPCDLLLNFGPFWFQKVDLFLWHGGQQSASETWWYSSESILKQAIWT